MDMLDLCQYKHLILQVLMLLCLGFGWQPYFTSKNFNETGIKKPYPFDYV